MRSLVVLSLLLFLPLFAPQLTKADQALSGVPPEPKTVEAALVAPSATKVELTGHIIKRISRTEYLFQDQTGTIKVDIDRELFQDRTITPEKKIQIIGTLDIYKKTFFVVVSHFTVLD